MYVEASPTGTTRNAGYPIRKVGSSRFGARVCRTGATTGTQCGKVTKVRYYEPANKNVGAISNVTVASFCVRPGDSGGPVYSRGLAYGVISGGDNSPCGHAGITWGSYYTEMSTALTLMNVELP